MTSAYELIGQLMNKVSTEMSGDESFVAVRAFEMKALPIPLDSIYLSFSPEKITVSYPEEDGEYKKRTDIEICINCFAPLSKKAHNAERLAENVMKFINGKYAENVAGYTIDGAVYEGNVRAYKIKSLIKFSFYE